MSKKIIIEVGDTKQVMTPSGLRGGYNDEIKISLDGGGAIRTDELAGILMIAYHQAVQEFLNTHPVECRGCPA